MQESVVYFESELALLKKQLHVLKFLDAVYMVVYQVCVLSTGILGVVSTYFNFRGNKEQVFLVNVFISINAFLAMFVHYMRRMNEARLQFGDNKRIEMYVALKEMKKLNDPWNEQYYDLHYNALINMVNMEKRYMKASVQPQNNQPPEGKAEVGGGAAPSSYGPRGDQIDSDPMVCQRDNPFGPQDQIDSDQNIIIAAQCDDRSGHYEAETLGPRDEIDSDQNITGHWEIKLDENPWAIPDEN